MNSNLTAKIQRKRIIPRVKLKNLKNKTLMVLEGFKRKTKMAGEMETMAFAADEGIQKMEKVFRFFTGNLSWDKKESEALDKIDSARLACLKSKEEIIIRDFGAGSTEEGRSEKQMENGVEVLKLVGDVCRGASTFRKWGELLFKIYREFKFEHCLELGTCVGFSGAYQAAAMELNGKGKLVTLEGAESLAGIAQKNLAAMGFDNVEVVVGKFSDSLEGVLKKLSPVDFAFVDGHHDEKATIMYFDQIWPFLSDEAVVIFDDINWSRGMKRAWNFIRHDYRVMASIDLYKWGICMVNKRNIKNKGEPAPKRIFNMWIH